MTWAGLLAVGAFAALAACSPNSPPPPPVFQLDCAKGFDALSAQLAADPSLQAAPPVSGEPYVIRNARDGSASYFVTQAGAPGHPAILRQEPVRVDGKLEMKNTGCPFGDRAGYDQLMAYLETLSRAAAPASR